MEWFTTAQILFTYVTVLISQLTTVQVAIVAGVGQVLGYVLYIRGSLRHELEPNPAAWLMFAYGTALLTILEFDIGAERELLILPIICATLSIGVAYICWHRGSLGWPEHPADRFAFIADIVLTAGYIAAWWMVGYGSITETERESATIVFLVLSNLTTLTAFSPLLRDAFLSPDHERSSAWVVWSLAYATLGIATAMNHGFMTPLMIYPAMNTVLHFAVGWFARPSRRRRRRLKKVPA
jgi:hypothetical protein